MRLLHGVFFNEKPVKTLTCLAQKGNVWYANMVAKKIDCTYPHMMSILKTFEQTGLIRTKEAGRIRIIELTEPGEELAHDFENILRRMEKFGDLPAAAEGAVVVKKKKPVEKPAQGAL